MKEDQTIQTPVDEGEALPFLFKFGEEFEETSENMQWKGLESEKWTQMYGMTDTD